MVTRLTTELFFFASYGDARFAPRVRAKISKSLEFLEDRRGNPEFEIFGIAKDLTISLISLEIQPSRAQSSLCR